MTGAEFFAIMLLSIHETAYLTFAALGGIFSYHVGIFNISLEGAIVVAIFGFIIGGIITGIYVGALLVAIIFSVIYMIFFGVLKFYFKINEFVAGLFLNLLAVSMIPLVSSLLFNSFNLSPSITLTSPLLLERGIALFTISTIPLAFIAWIILYQIPLGLRIRAAGQYPEVVRALGGNVRRIQYGGLILSGIFCGLAASAIVPTEWTAGQIAGRGYLAVMVMLLARWNPLFVLIVVLIFRTIEGLLLSIAIDIPYLIEIIDVVPYAITLIGLLIFFAAKKLVQRHITQ